MRYQIHRNYVQGSNLNKLFCLIAEPYQAGYGEHTYTYYRIKGKVRKDGSTDTKKRIMYANSRREMIGKIKAKFPNLKKVTEMVFEDK